MIKIAGTLPVKSRLPLSAWLLAALVTVFSFASSLINLGMMPNQAISIGRRETSQRRKLMRTYWVPLAHLADVLTWPG